VKNTHVDKEKVHIEYQRYKIHTQRQIKGTHGGGNYACRKRNGTPSVNPHLLYVKPNGSLTSGDLVQGKSQLLIMSTHLCGDLTLGKSPPPQHTAIYIRAPEHINSYSKSLKVPGKG